MIRGIAIAAVFMPVTVAEIWASTLLEGRTTAKGKRIIRLLLIWDYIPNHTDIDRKNKPRNPGTDKRGIKMPTDSPVKESNLHRNGALAFTGQEL